LQIACSFEEDIFANSFLMLLLISPRMKNF
jgi:hypothetical protein